jgi:hypothetical protein
MLQPKYIITVGFCTRVLILCFLLATAFLPFPDREFHRFHIPSPAQSRFSPVSCHSDVILSVACFFDVILPLLILLFDVIHPYSLSPSWFFRFRNPSPAPLFSLFLESATWFLAVIIHSDVILIFLCDVLLTFSDVIHSDVIIRRVILLIRFILLIRCNLWKLLLNIQNYCWIIESKTDSIKLK